MKISQEEIDAALLGYYTEDNNYNSAFKADMRRALEAAYTVREQRKAAKRERQRKEREDALDKKIREGAVFGRGSVETWAQARVEVFPPDTPEAKEKDKQVVESVKPTSLFAGMFGQGDEKAFNAAAWGNLEALAGISSAVQSQKERTPSKAPEWDGTFTAGDYEAANGKRVTIKTGQMIDFYGAHLRGFSDELQDGYHWFTDGKSDMALRGWDLIRPWPKPTEGERL